MVQQDSTGQSASPVQENTTTGAPQTTSTPTEPPRPARTSGLGIAGIVIGIMAILGSWVPILNNVTFFVGLIGLVLSIVGVIKCMRGKSSGKGVSIAGIALNVIAMALVLATQGLYGAAIDSVTDSGADAVTYSQNGKSATTKDGLKITVNSVTPNVKDDYSSDKLTRVSVTYKNTGDEKASINPYDWKGVTKSGEEVDVTLFTSDKKALESKDLVKGGTTTGNIYFEGKIAKVQYYDNIASDEPTASWKATS